jgi:DNA processing protein
MNDIVYDIWFSLLRLDSEESYIEKYGSAKEIFAMTGRMMSAEGLTGSDILKMTDAGIKEEAVKISEFCVRNKVDAVTGKHRSYPRLLNCIGRPPKLLYIKGAIDSRRKCIAVVGSRNPSPYGLKCTAYFAGELSRRGYVIVSGLALGIDSKAHMTALENNGKTYSVLGSGIGNIYPSSNEDLAQVITENGALISEYAPYAKPDKWHFPERNRIISGICHATLIVEGKTNSGSLITATHSIEQGREVFCVPGNIFSENSRGVNSLINEGARLVNSPEEIDEYVSGLLY